MNEKLALTGGTPVRTRPYPSWPISGPEEEQALMSVLRSHDWTRGYGTAVRAFEEGFAAYHDARHGIAVLNGTVSLRLALLSIGLEAGDEVIVPPYSFVSTASAVIEANGTPIFADIDPDTYNLDPAQVEAALTSRTRAIIPVHFAGLPADMDRLMEIARRHNLSVIEDAAHAHGAMYKGRKVGAIGDVGSFSFQGSKNITAGEGGILLTDNAALAADLYSLHDAGRVAGLPRYIHENPGGNYRMTEWQGAVLACQLDRLEAHACLREANGRRLAAGFASVPGLVPLHRDPDAITRHAYHLFILRYDPDVFGGASAAVFCEAMRAEGVPCQQGYAMPLYRQGLFQKKNFRSFTGYRQARPDLDYTRVLCPVSEQACREAVWIYHSVLQGTAADVDDILTAAEKVRRLHADLPPADRAAM